jgi:hypothetical protein
MRCDPTDISCIVKVQLSIDDNVLNQSALNYLLCLWLVFH